MTVAIKPPFNEYTAAPGAVMFTYDFKIIRLDDIEISVNGIIQTTGFTVTGVGDNDGGDVVFGVPMIGGEDVLLRMKVDFDRLTDYQQNGDFLSPTVNNDFDRLWLAMQQLGQSLLSAIKLPFTTTSDQIINQSPAERANTVLAFDASGNLTTSTTDAANVAAAQAAAAAAQAAAASIDPTNLVHRTGNESVAGIKAFSDSPTVPSLSVGDTSLKAAPAKLVVDSIAASPPRGHINGVQMSTAGSSTTITTSSGEASNSTASILIKLVASIAKTTAAWAVGSTFGGLDTGSIANNTTYHFYLIRRPDTGVVDVVFSINASAPTLPANYTQYRRIYSWRTNGSGQWVAGSQDGDFFELASPASDVVVTNPGTSAILRALSIPTGINVMAKISFTNVGNSATFFLFSDPATTDVAPAAAFSQSSASAVGVSGADLVRTNTSGQIRSRTSFSDANTGMYITTVGWFDQRGRNV